MTLTTRQENERKPSHRRDLVRQQVAELLASDTPPAIIAKALGISKSTIYAWIAQDEALQASRRRAFEGMLARAAELEAERKRRWEQRQAELAPARRERIAAAREKLRIKRDRRLAERVASALRQWDKGGLT